MKIIKPPELPFLTFACDESSQTTDEYMVIGGIALKSKTEHEVTRDLATIKGDKFATSEIKWGKTKGADRLALHKKTIDYFFHKLDVNRLHFHGLVVPFSDFDHDLTPDGSKDNSVTRMYYQLCLRRPVQYYGKQCAIHIKPDHADAYLGFRYFIDALNNDAKKKFGITTRPVREMTFPRSDRSAIHQINDLIIGSIAHRRNERHLVEGASVYKCELADYVHKKIKDIKMRKNFTIWNFNSPYLKAKPPT